MIHKDIQELAIDIDTVQPHPRNVRQGDVGAISESLQRNGQYRPIVVQTSTNYILAGNHTWRAAKMLGWETIAATFVDVNDEHGLRILLVDNRTNDIATYDNNALAELLRELAETDEQLLGTAFDGDYLDDLIAENKSSTLQDFPAFDENLETQYKCPKCMYEWSGKQK